MTLPAVRSSGPLDRFRELENRGRLPRRGRPARRPRDDITVDLAGSELAVTGELTERERRGLFRYRTRRTGRFSYRAWLPRDIEADRVEATLANGVLTVRVPKSEAARPRRIAVRGR